MQLSGKLGFVTIGASTFAFSKWKVSIKCEPVKVTNFNSNGFQQLVPGIHSATVSVSGPYDVGAMPIVVGGLYEFYLGLKAGTFIKVPAMVTGWEPDNDVEGAPQLTINGESTGTFTITFS